MARVRMVMDVSGLRGGTEDALGVPWPQHGEILETGDGEAASLIAAGIAEPVAAERVAKPAVQTEPAAGEETQEPAKPVQARTTPRPRTAAK